LLKNFVGITLITIRKMVNRVRYSRLSATPNVNNIMYNDKSRLRKPAWIVFYIKYRLINQSLSFYFAMSSFLVSGFTISGFLLSG
jgi:hypothetical protein